MEIKSLINLNITLLLENQVDQNLFSNQDVFKIVSPETEDIKHRIIEGPGLKIFQFPENDFEIVFEPQRLVVNDRAGGECKDSRISEISLALLEKAKGEAKSYGYNFDFKVNVHESFAIEHLLGEKLIGFSSITDVGATLSFIKDDVRVGLNIKPIKDTPEEFWINVNIHHEEVILDSLNDIKSNLVKAHEIAKEVILSI